MLKSHDAPQPSSVTKNVVLIGLVSISAIVLISLLLLNRSNVEEVNEIPPLEPIEESSIAIVTSESVFGLKLVPDAVERIALPSLPDSTDESDTAYYEAAKNRLENGNLRSSDQAFESPYMFGFGPLAGLNLLNQHDSRELLLQAHDELLILTDYYNNELNRQSPVERGVADATTPPYEAAVWTVAPSSHIVLALFFRDILMQAIADSAHADITQMIEDFIERGVVYGLYAESDIETSRALYTQYKAAVLENYPLLSNAF